MARRINTIVIPAAGQGTRLLPATRVTAKEMLPIFDTPMLQFAMDEAAATGAARVSAPCRSSSHKERWLPVI